MKKIISHFKRNWIQYGFEIIVITLGILIAFGLNNWGEIRKSNLLERKILLELLASGRNTLNHLDDGIEWSMYAEESIEYVISYLDSDITPVDSIEFHFGRSIFWYRLNPDFNAYETAKNYGLHLFQNDSIRILVSSIYEQTLPWDLIVENRNSEYYGNSVTPKLTKLFNHSAILEPMKPNNLNELKKDTEYRNILETLRINRQRDVMWFKDSREQLKRLELMILAELDSN